jgi:hypothetical protein
MKTNLVLNYRNVLSLILVFVLFSLVFGKVQAAESNPQQPSIAGKYQAIYAGEDKSGYHHIIIIINTETGKVEKRIFYDEVTDKQEVINYFTKEVAIITPFEEKEPRKIVR